MRVTRAPSVAAPSSLVRMNAAAAAPERSSKLVPGPGMSESDATTSATRALPAATASAALMRASRPGVGRAGAEGAAGLCRETDGGREHRVARAFGERWTGGAPPQPVDDVGLKARGGEGAEGGVGGEGEDVFVGRAGRSLTPPTLAPPGRGDLGCGKPPGGRGGADRDDLYGVAHDADVTGGPQNGFRPWSARQ